MEFSSSPPSKFLVTSLPQEKEKVEALCLLLGDLLDQRVLMKVLQSEQGQGFYNHVFVVMKPPGKFRLILNLRPLNRSLRYKHFRTESIFLVASVLFPGCFMAIIGLRNAYLHILVHLSFQRYLRLAVRVNLEIHHFQCETLPFCLALSQKP